MSMQVNFHVHGNEKLETQSLANVLQRDSDDGEFNSAYIKLRVGSKDVTLFFQSIEDIDKVAFEMATLAMHAREVWYGEKVLDGEEVPVIASED